MSGFGGLVPSTLAYSTLDARGALVLPDEGRLLSVAAPSSDGCSETAGDHAQSVTCVLEVIAALEPLARLMHSLQSERGYTSCWVASRGSLFGSEVAEARKATDLAVAGRDSAQTVRARLARLRQAADRDVANRSADPADVGAALYDVYSGSAALTNQVHQELSSLPVCAATYTFSAFASLKEAYGVIRACVSGSLLLSDAAFATVSSKMKGDLVLALHRRKAYARVIKHQAPRTLLRLISAGMEVGPALARTLETLESDCDPSVLRGVVEPRVWWASVTSYINTLEQLERAMLGECQQTAQRRAEMLERRAECSNSPPSPCSSAASDHSCSASPTQRMASLGLRRSGPSAKYRLAASLARHHSMPACSSPAATSLFGRNTRCDSYTRLFGNGAVSVGAGGSAPTERGGALPAADDGLAWTLLSAAALLTLGRASVHGNVGGAAAIGAHLHTADAEVLKARLCQLVEARADGSGTPSPQNSYAASPSQSPYAGRWRPGGCHSGSAASDALGASSTPANEGPLPIGSVPAAGAAGVPLPDSEWRIGLREILFEHRIGVGGAGATYLAQWKGARVAVKVAGGVGSSGWLDSWRAEVEALAQLRHPHVVEYLGCVVEPPTYCLVLEHCAGGDLYQALRRPTPAGLASRVARGVAAGMAYLHSRRFIHRDLKSSNVLLDSAGDAKLMDFGLSRRVGSSEMALEELTAETGTYRWMAPEVIRHEAYSGSADVFSYGMLLFELLTHEVPYADRPPLQAAVCTGLQGLRPPLPDGTPAPLRSLVARCWDMPQLRPTFAELVLELTPLFARELSEEELRWLDEPAGHRVVYGNAPVAAPYRLPGPQSHPSPDGAPPDNSPLGGRSPLAQATPGMTIDQPVLPPAGPMDQQVWAVPVGTTKLWASDRA